MAVFNSFPGIEFTVCVDDKPLKEYESTEDEVTLNESQGLGKKFEVAQHQSSVTVKNLTRAVEGNIYKEDKKELLQTLQFTETHLTQCDDLIEAVTRLDRNGRFVGEIEVRVPQAMYLSKANLVSRAPLVSKTEIPENQLKGQAKSHSRLFGQGEAKSKGKYQKMEFLDGGREYPIAILNFDHGSRDCRDLETLGVIERSPEPELSFATSVPASSSNVIPPINSASWNVRDLDPTQTGNSFGQFLQYLQTQGGGQPAQAPPPFPVGTIIAALPNLSTSIGSSDATATSKPPPTQARERRE
ncbi:hypothetical protein BofuT4_P043420.1 [Botrytis cinerea T4]|uniref:DUF7918 domain-containing protein n=1 Tax=Botryotinia fuckeliana (strain T4) TaxID=999810 RepID=G2Y241_BOTF4|nr:hypothetical protein BofuT4_P043420.1 [Botrytis cinerea T4]